MNLPRSLHALLRHVIGNDSVSPVADASDAEACEGTWDWKADCVAGWQLDGSKMGGAGRVTAILGAG